MILVLQIELLFVLQQASCSEALHSQKIQRTHFTQNHYQKLLKHLIQSSLDRLIEQGIILVM
jgi:hypothetical protein